MLLLDPNHLVAFQRASAIMRGDPMRALRLVFLRRFLSPGRARPVPPIGDKFIAISPDRSRPFAAVEAAQHGRAQHVPPEKQRGPLERGMSLGRSTAPAHLLVYLLRTRSLTPAQRALPARPAGSCAPGGR